MTFTITVAVSPVRTGDPLSNVSTVNWTERKFEYKLFKTQLRIAFGNSYLLCYRYDQRHSRNEVVMIKKLVIWLYLQIAFIYKFEEADVVEAKNKTECQKN